MIRIYHITDKKNLTGILVNKGLYSKNKERNLNVLPVSIAYEGIQERRAEIEVPIPPFGNLHDYIPFYFAPRSPMLYAIHKGMIEGYAGGQRDIIYLVSTVQDVEAHKLPFVFTDGHAIMALSDFYNQSCDLDKIDWDIMKKKYWVDTEEDSDRKRRRQAEFLVKDFIPFDCLTGIAVMDANMETESKNILKQYGKSLAVKVKYRWYY